jgi:hypothetical protein
MKLLGNAGRIGIMTSRNVPMDPVANHCLLQWPSPRKHFRAIEMHAVRHLQARVSPRGN